jgi:hypothetical protein
VSVQEAAEQDGESGDRWKQVRERALKRDSYECRFCGMSDEEHQEENGAGLDVHHIIPRRDGGADRMHNLAALCRSCHSTMESLHGQAMGEIVHEKSHRDDLEDLVQALDEARERWEDADSTIREFVENHPAFCDRFGFVSDADVVECWELDKPVRNLEYPHSEWKAVALYGYTYGMCATWHDIENSLEFDFGEFREPEDGDENT